MRFSIKWLLIAVAAVAAGCVALLNASDLWADVVSGTVVVCLLIALIGTVASQGHRRAFCWGFAVFGWGYLLLMETLSGWSLSLVTQRLLEQLHGLVAAETEIPRDEYWEMQGLEPGPPVDPGGGGGLGEASGAKPGMVREVLPMFGYFLKIGHAICLLLFALLGGLTGRYFHPAAPQQKAGDKRVS